MSSLTPLRPARWPLAVALAAATACALAIVVFAAQLDGFRHASHPLGWLGGRGLPGAALFNVLAYVLPGGLLATLGWRLREVLPAYAGLGARIGSRLLLLAALAFAAQGVFSLDLEELDAGDSRGHAAAWMLWWMAFVPGVWCYEIGRARLGGQHHWLPGLLLGGMAFPFLALLAPALMAPGFAQRLALAAWFGWWLLAGWRLSRGAASSPESSPPARR